MRIALDCSAIPRRMAGAGVYSYQLVRALAKIESGHEFVVFARAGLFDDLATDNKRVRVAPVNAGSRVTRLAWEQAALPFLLRRHGIDLLHSTHHHTPVVAGGSVKRVVTFHDVTFLVLPKRYPLVRRLYMSTLTRAAARVADAIITPSRSTRDDVVRKLGVNQDRITVIPYAAGPQYTPSDAAAVARVRERYRLAGDYILSVSSLEPGKNRTRLIRAVARLREEGVDCRLAIAGQPGWRYEGDMELARELGLGDRVHYLGYVPDDDLPPLYSGAALLAYPSLYEGFGLPVLEAQACGTPVIASLNSAFPEIVDDSAWLVKPDNLTEISQSIQHILNNPEFKEKLIKKGLEKCIDAVLPVFAKMDGKTGKKARSLSLKRERAHLEEEIAGQLISLGRGLYEKLSKDKERSMAKQLEVEDSITNIEANVNVLVKLY
ncbi:MAG: glycosyltransferase family 4 protein, partial [Chloroflexi bacterium]|nr:glycosyltransferase family 4 protein [Chloroflexota bacterium]